jgi:hypothetical protein
MKTARELIDEQFNISEFKYDSDKGFHNNIRMLFSSLDQMEKLASELDLEGRSNQHKQFSAAAKSAINGIQKVRNQFKKLSDFAPANI